MKYNMQNFSYKVNHENVVIQILNQVYLLVWITELLFLFHVLLNKQAHVNDERLPILLKNSK